MKQDALITQAIAEIEQRVQEAAREPRVVHCEAESEWSAFLLLPISEHSLHVLARGADVIVYFDEDGKEIGWRDDGRHGSEYPCAIDRDIFLETVTAELNLSKHTRLGKLEPQQLPPLGWTHQAVLFLSPNPGEGEVLQVWASPETLKVIQCLRK